MRAGKMIVAAFVAPPWAPGCLNPPREFREAAALEVISRHMIQEPEGIYCLHQHTKLHCSAQNIASFVATHQALLEIMEPGRDRIDQVTSLLIDSIYARHVSYYDRVNIL